MEREQFKVYVLKYIKLLSLYLNEKEDKDFSIDPKELNFFYKLSKYHSLRAILYLALTNCKIEVKPEQLADLERCYLNNVKKTLAFDKERQELYKYLNDNQINFLPLKGIIINDYYLCKDAREFADNDILFEESKDVLVKKYFKDHGYEVEVFDKSNHDVYLKKPFFNFEMHRALFGETGDNQIIIDYFKDYLTKAPIKEDYEHYLKDEDFYIYFTAHSYKHFHNSGCGIRTLVDYYQYLKNKQLDFDYINQELEKINLVDFSNQIKTLSFKVFNDEPLNEEEEQMLLFIASSGTYGTLENSVDKGVKEKGKFKYLMIRVFPPYSFYKKTYPWAYKTVVLIPVAWLCRLFRIIFKNPKKATQELKLISEHKNEKKDQPSK